MTFGKRQRAVRNVFEKHGVNGRNFAKLISTFEQFNVGDILEVFKFDGEKPLWFPNASTVSVIETRPGYVTVMTACGIDMELRVKCRSFANDLCVYFVDMYSRYVTKKDQF